MPTFCTYKRELKMKTKVVNIYKEPYDICIMRPSILGNHYIIGRDGTRKEVVVKHKTYMYNRIKWDKNYLAAIEALRDLKIGCCCAPLACHGDNYVEFLEGGK